MTDETVRLRELIYAAYFVAEYREVAARGGNGVAIDDVPRIHEEARAVAEIWEEGTQP
jgi:hypothetical protein